MASPIIAMREWLRPSSGPFLLSWPGAQSFLGKVLDPLATRHPRPAAALSACPIAARVLTADPC